MQTFPGTAAFFLVLCAAFWLGPAAAAEGDPAAPMQPAPPKLDPRACADHERMTEGDIVGTEGRAARDAEPLGDKLARTDGVICPPPGLDPAIRAPAPDTGTTPVIPPPGSPGGDPDVRPK